MPAEAVTVRNVGRGGSAGAAGADGAAALGSGAGAGSGADDVLDAELRDAGVRAGAGVGRGAGAGVTGAGAGAGAAGCSGAGAAAGGGAAGSGFGALLSVPLPEQPAAMAELSRAAVNQCFVIVVTSGWEGSRIGPYENHVK